LGAAGAVAGFTFDPDSGTQAMLAGQIGGDKDVFLALFEVMFRLAEEAESLGGHLEEPVDGHGIAGELEGFAFALILAGTVSADPSVALAANSAIAIAVTVAIAVPVLALACVSLVSGMLRAGVRVIGIRRSHDEIRKGIDSAGQAGPGRSEIIRV
jgi:hypothetical protein